MAASASSAALAKVLEVLREAVASSGFDRDLEPGVDRQRLLFLLADERQNSYTRFAAALNLAIAGDTRAIPVLRKVFDVPGFAMTNSCHEQGLAALGLAVLGDVESLPRVRSCTRINRSGYWCDIARPLLEEVAARASREAE